MDDADPTIEKVCAVAATLYHNPDRVEKDKASTWLQAFQKSVFAWKISDEILHRKHDVEACYIAAQTMRSKIRYSFHELPKEAHHSLKDSLIKHVSSLDEQANNVIVRQLCLALADLVLVMPAWPNAATELVQAFAVSQPWPLLEVLTVLPEEVGSNQLRLGANRREQVLQDLRQSVPIVTEFLKVCLCEKALANAQYKINVFKCMSSWLYMDIIQLDGIEQNVVMCEAFRTVSVVTESSSVHEAATDCVCTLLVRLGVYHSPDSHQLELNVFTVVKKLEESYHMAVALEDTEKALNLCRVFTELAETMLVSILTFQPFGSHFAVSILDCVLMCCSHPEYEIPDITFNLWYRLSEEVLQFDDEIMITAFRPYIERLVNALCKQCQMEPDREGVLEEGEDFTEFRQRVVEVINDVVFLVESSNVFKHMLAHLQSVTNWEVMEASLFIMQSVAGSLPPSEKETVPQVVESLLAIPESTHIAVRLTSLKLMGQLCDWIDFNNGYLDRILNWILVGLQDKRLSNEAATALQSICQQCHRHMWPHFDVLIQILGIVDSFNLKPVTANGLIKGVAVILSYMPPSKIQDAMRTLCALQVTPLQALIDNSNGSAPLVKNSPSDPVLFLDRLASIFRHVSPTDLSSDAVHPCQQIITEIWPVLSAVCNRYLFDCRIMERCCRTLRFAVRCIGVQSAPLVEPLVKQLIAMYNLHPHSCFLYLGSILVDEYAHLDGCVEGFLNMLAAFVEPTFKLLSTMEGMKNHPDTIDDFFRLNARFLLKAAVPYLKSSMLRSVIECALQAIAIQHKDANASVMKFLFDLLHCGRSKTEREDFKQRAAIVDQIRLEYGSNLVDCLIRASILHLPSYTFRDQADVLFELMSLERTSVCKWLESTLKTLPGVEGQPNTQESSTFPLVTKKQLVKFHKSVTGAEHQKDVLDALREFSRFWR